MSAKWSIACVAAAAIVTSLVMMTMGWALPRPFSVIGPLAPREMRIELVREIAERQRPGCLLIVGNSRAAFNVNANALSTPGCGVTNLGFPALGAFEFYELARAESEATKIRTILLFLTDEYLMKNAMTFPEPRQFGLPQWIKAPHQSFAEFSLAKRARINLYRFNTLFESLMGKPLASNLFRWNAELRRWIWPSNEALIFDKLVDRSDLADAVAKEYYSNPIIGPRERLVDFLDRMRRLTTNLIIIFPPQHSSFARSVALLQPGVQEQLRDLLAEASKESGAGFVDCLKASDCGVADGDFADPMHLNAEGAVRFTQFLKEQNLLIRTENR